MTYSFCASSASRPSACALPPASAPAALVPTTAAESAAAAELAPSICDRDAVLTARQGARWTSRRLRIRLKADCAAVPGAVWQGWWRRRSKDCAGLAAVQAVA
jgi:hypothetical protein